MNKIKGNFFTIIITAVISITGTVFATYAYLASDIAYSNEKSEATNVQEAVDELYDLATIEEYNENTTITPATSVQILQTNGKKLTKNITINAIPSAYKKLSTTTTVTSDKLAKGITAYNSTGTLITGTNSSMCVSGTYTKPANANVSLDFGIKPDFYALIVAAADGNFNYYYVTKFSDGSLYNIQSDSTVVKTTVYTLNGTKITSNYKTTGDVYPRVVNITYYACTK